MPLRITNGAYDPYSPPEILRYLRTISAGNPRIEVRALVEGASLEVTYDVGAEGIATYDLARVSDRGR